MLNKKQSSEIRRIGDNHAVQIFSQKLLILTATLLLLSSLFFTGAPAKAAVTETITTPGSYNWTAPWWVTSVQVELWGGGASGGGGGAYAKKASVSVAPGSSYTIIVGGVGQDSTFDTSVVVADGASGSTGGQAANCTGDVGSKFSGGNAGSPGCDAYSCWGGGGGGGAGSAGNGNNGNGSIRGLGGTPNGGDGGSGAAEDGTCSGEAQDGFAPGGGGGGRVDNNCSGYVGVGAPGQAILTYADPPPPVARLFSGFKLYVGQRFNLWYTP